MAQYISSYFWLRDPKHLKKLMAAINIKLLMAAMSFFRCLG
jgi:hypothetical protein